jgi:4-amino-4-deoxy-L-arabinose transferase-like glycosyltransferase
VRRPVAACEAARHGVDLVLARATLEGLLTRPDAARLARLLALAAFLLTVAYAFIHRILPASDARAYDTMAQNLLAGHGFRLVPGSDPHHDYALVYPGPGYQFFLAGVYWLVGHSHAAVWVVQAALHALSTLLVFSIGRELFASRGEGIGLAAAALYGFSPDLIEIAAMLLTETLYLFLTALTTWLFVRAYRSDEPRWPLAMGVAMGLAILTRPPILLFVPVVGAALLWRRRWTHLTLVAVSVALVLTPWTLRNYAVFGQLMLTGVAGETNLWFGNRSGSDGGQMTTGFPEFTLFVEQYGLGAVRQKAIAEFLGFVTTYPLEFVRLCVLRAIRYFSLIRPMGFWFYQSGLPQMAFVAASAAYIALLFWFGFAGMVMAARERGSLLRFFVALALLSPLVLLPTLVQSRYRFQIYPFLAVLAGYALWRALADWSAARPYILGVAGALAAVSAVDGLMYFPVILDRLAKVL